jgi:CopG family transcriptional regulator/antitoxin EndoAI
MLYWIPLQCNIASMAITRTSRVYTISLPPELARKAEALAKRDSRTMSELFREAFRTYYAQQSRKVLEEIGEYASRRSPGYMETDVPGLIKEVRSVTPARRRHRVGALGEKNSRT